MPKSKKNKNHHRPRMKIRGTTNPVQRLTPLRFNSEIDTEWEKHYNTIFDDTVQSVTILAKDNKQIVEKLTLHDFHNGVIRDTKQATALTITSLIEYLTYYNSVRGYTLDHYLNALETKCDFYRARGVELSFFYTFIRGIMDKSVLNKDLFAIQYFPKIIGMFLIQMPEILKISSGYYSRKAKKKLQNLRTNLKIFINLLSIIPIQDEVNKFYTLLDNMTEDEFTVKYKNGTMIYDTQEFEEIVDNISKIILLNMRSELPDVLIFIDIGMIDFLDIDNFLITNFDDMDINKINHIPTLLDTLFPN